MEIAIRQGTIDELLALTAAIPEFSNPYDREVYEEKLRGKASLLLLAESEGVPAGFKLGYDRFGDGSFYSWMGGILPGFRNQGVYQQLTFEMERWAAERGYHIIRLKTRNKLLAMIRFCLAAGYHISGFEAHADPMESRIWFSKTLQQSKASESS